MELHQTDKFREWYGKAVYSQPSGTVDKDFSMLCWIVSFSGRITDRADSFKRWTENYLKFRQDKVVYEHDEVTFNALFDKYNMKTAEELGLGDVKQKRMAQFTTDLIGGDDYHREFQNDWLSQSQLAACES